MKNNKHLGAHSRFFQNNLTSASALIIIRNLIRKFQVYLERIN